MIELIAVHKRAGCKGNLPHSREVGRTMSLDSINCFVGLDDGKETMEALWIDEKGEIINSMGFSDNHEG